MKTDGQGDKKCSLFKNTGESEKILLLMLILIPTVECRYVVDVVLMSARKFR